MTVATLTLTDGAQVVLHKRGNPEGPRLLVSHGTGFAVDGFRRMWEPLCDAFDVITFDLRHHGRNPPCDPMSIDAERQNLDMSEVVLGAAELFGARPVAGLFHSISALAALRVETRARGTFSHLVLMEPPAPPPQGHALCDAFEAGRIALAERSARRQDKFSSVEELAAKYQGRAAFSCFQEGAALELAESILLKTETGFELRCTPLAESRYYETNHDDGLFDRADQVGCPVLMLAGRNDLAHAGTPAQIAIELAHAGGYDYAELASATHMMPLERPQAVAAFARAFVQAG